MLDYVDGTSDNIQAPDRGITMNAESNQVSEETEIHALFQGGDDDDKGSFAEGFKDLVREVHEKFDRDGDGYLSFSELAALQQVTEGARLSEENYVMACRALDCNPSQGISLDALRLTYAAEGTSIGTFLVEGNQKLFTLGAANHIRTC